MKVREIFEISESNNQYRRVECKYNVDISLGRDLKGNLSLVIIEKGEIQKVNSSEVINVYLRKRKDKKLILGFDLLDAQLENLFIWFCEDLIQATENISKEDAITFCIKRWNTWKKMFSKSKSEYLCESEIKGLIGELYFLKNYLVKNYGKTLSIKSWEGANLNHKDFIFEDTWFEIKTISENSENVNINSLEQLDSTIEGNLIINLLEKTNELDKESFNLNLLVKDIIKIIKENNDLLEEFSNKLLNINYNFEEYYENYYYKIVKVKRYIVNENFPRIVSRNLNEEIVNVKYSLNVKNLKKYEGVIKL